MAAKNYSLFIPRSSWWQNNKKYQQFQRLQENMLTNKEQQWNFYVGRVDWCHEQYSEPSPKEQTNYCHSYAKGRYGGEELNTASLMYNNLVFSYPSVSI